MFGGKIRHVWRKFSLWQKITSYVMWEFSWKIPLQAGCGPAARPFWPGII
jgi:hypothetical protein